MNSPPKEFIPPSEEIWKLFRASPVIAPVSTAASTSATVATQPTTAVAAEDTHACSVFTEEEFQSMPSTLAKAIRKTQDLLEETERVKRQSIHINNELKGVLSLMVRHGKKQLKTNNATEAAATSGGPPSGSKPLNQNGFCRPGPISDSMCDFLNVPRGQWLSRVEVNNRILEYIRTNELVDPNNAQRIVPDQKMSDILSPSAFEESNNKITYFSIQKFIKHHFLKASASSTTTNVSSSSCALNV